MQKYPYAVLIGRFQPFHKGHCDLFNHAAEIADHVIIVVGSHNAPQSIRNPWNTQQRLELIRLALSDYSDFRYSITSVADSAYNFTDWIIRVQRSVESRVTSGVRGVLVGHYKDDTSYYLNYFPQWDLAALPSQAGGISSTSIRTALFEDKIETIEPLLHEEVFNTIKRWITTDDFKELKEEYLFIQNYRKKWEKSPYPPTFVTADAVVFALGHVLLIKRKVNPGKGRYAIPGGFVNTNESIESGCLRELREETSLDLGYNQIRSSIKMTHVFDHPLRDPRGRIITHASMIELAVKELPAIKGGDDAAEVLWFPLYRLEEVENTFFNDHAQIIKFFMNRTK